MWLFKIDIKMRKIFRFLSIPSIFTSRILISLERKKESLPDIFTGALVLIYVSEEMRDLLMQFDLGRTRFHEVPLREFDQRTPYSRRRWFLMHILENRKTFLPDLSTGLREVGITGEVWQAIPEGKNKLAVDPKAAENLDLWLDRTILSRVFVSDRLKAAIKASDLSARWLGFRACKVEFQKSR